MLKKSFIFLLLVCSGTVFSQETKDDLKIFLDCNRSDNTFIKQNLGNVSLEELLLQQQQLQSGYNYFFNVGLSYSFGSIYNTIVNPRFNF